MTVPLIPNMAYDVTLRYEDDMPETSRAVFRVKALSGRQQIALSVRLDELEKTVAAPEYPQKLFDIAREFVVGWELPDGRAFDAAALEDVMSIEECHELIYAVYRGRLALVSLKNSESQLPTNMGKSAKATASDAEKAAANQTT